MDPQTDPIYAGLAGVEIEGDEWALGHGVTLRATYAHFMAPFLMAFAPAPEGKPHPAPWSPVKGGLGIDIELELHVPSDFALPEFFDRLNTVWWITALIRLRGGTDAHVPVIADRRLADIPNAWSEATILPVEVRPRRSYVLPGGTLFSSSDLEWLKATWIPGGRLMHKEPEFYEAFQAFDSAPALPTSSLSMLTMWGALEHLFSPSKQELRFRVSANIAAFLEPPGQSRVELHRRLLRLYDARSVAAHSARSISEGAWMETYDVAKRVILKMLSDGRVPSKEIWSARYLG